MNWTHPAFSSLARLVRDRTGLVFRPDRRPGVEVGVRRAMGRAGVDEVETYCRLVAQDPALMDDLAAEVTVPETYFFREPGQFDFLRRVALPEILGRKDDDQPIRVWSAACSTGEEAYSLAMLLADEGLAGRARVLATDLSRAALDRARKADYGDWSLRGEGAAAARRHLREVGGRHVVAEGVRRGVVFEHLNLALDVFPSQASGVWGLDLILCRNVLIYFDAETVRGVAGRLLASLAPGGWLVTASTDPPLAELAPFETVASDQGVFYRCQLAPAPAPTRVDEAAHPAPPAPHARRPADAADSELERLAAALDAARDDLARGDYARAADRTRPLGALPEACALHARALANIDPAEAERACAGAVGRHPLSEELHYLHAVLLLGLGRDDDASRATRRALYLDRSLAIAHFALGSILRRSGDLGGARRAFRNARDLCAARPPDSVVKLSDGEPAGRLAESARTQLAALDGPGPEGVRP